MITYIRNNVSASKELVSIVNKDLINQRSRSSMKRHWFFHCWNQITASKRVKNPGLFEMIHT